MMCFIYIYIYIFYGKNISIHSSKTELQQRADLQKQLQATFITNEILNYTWNNTFPNLRDTGPPSFFCKIMGNFVAIPFQMLKKTPSKRSRKVPYILNNVPKIITHITFIDYLYNGEGIRFKNNFGEPHL